MLIASSSGLESAHESDRLQGSFFTYHFTGGLRGAADRNGNGEITMTEAFEYAKERTIRDTLRVASETQHPATPSTCAAGAIWCWPRWPPAPARCRSASRRGRWS